MYYVEIHIFGNHNVHKIIDHILLEFAITFLTFFVQKTKTKI